MERRRTHHRLGPYPQAQPTHKRTETPEQAEQRARTDTAMITLAHDAALRCSELLALRWKDIEAPDDDRLTVVRIRRSKTD